MMCSPYIWAILFSAVVGAKSFVGGWLGWRSGGLLGGLSAGGALFLHPPHRQFEQWRPAFTHAHLLVIHVEFVVQLQHGSSVREKLRQVVGRSSLGELWSASGHVMVAVWLIVLFHSIDSCFSRSFSTVEFR